MKEWGLKGQDWDYVPEACTSIWYIFARRRVACCVLMGLDNDNDYNE